MNDGPPKAGTWNWLDRVLSIDEAERNIEAYRDLDPSEWYFRLHFPVFPVMPGVFLLEAMAHAVGVLLALRFKRQTGRWHHYVLTAAHEVRFYRYVRPGDRLLVAAHLLTVDADPVSARVIARVGADKVARATLSLNLVDAIHLPESENENLGGATVPVDDPFGLVAYLERVLPRALKERYGVSGSPPGPSRERRSE